MRSIPVILIATVIAITACEKPPPAEAEPAAPAVVVAAKDIVGRWVIHSADYRDAAFNLIKNQVEARDLPVDDKEIERHVDEVADFFRKTAPVYTFDADNTFRFEAGEVSSEGKWSVSGDKLTITPEGDRPEVVFRYEPGFLRLIPRTDWGRSISLIPG